MIRKIKNFIKQLYDPDIEVYASSLSFYTIFSIIPILLLSFTIYLKITDFDNNLLRDFIFEHLIPSKQQEITLYIDKFLANSSKLGTIGVGFIIFASIMFFQNYEYIVNKIFDKKPKVFWKAMGTYLTLVTLTPVALALSLYLLSKIKNYLNTPYVDVFAIFSYLIIWIMFLINYKISINTTLSFKSAAISSFLASSIWYIGKIAFVYYIIYNKTYITLYGSFATILFFFLWIYISWLIYLYGLKLCHIIDQKEKIE